MRSYAQAIALVAVSLFPAGASALVLPPRAAALTSGHVEATGALVAPQGKPPLRGEVSTRYGMGPGPAGAPQVLSSAWSMFLADTQSSRWQALWDADTRRPLRIFGSYIPAKGTSNSAPAAEKHARAFLARHAGLLLAGHSVSDFDLLTNHTENGLRTLGFQQMTTAGGVRIPVLEGRVSLRYKADRLFVLGSEALYVEPFPAPERTAEEAGTAALGYLLSTIPGASIFDTDLVALPLVRKSGARVSLAFRVRTISDSPPSQMDVFVDAMTGEILATRENVRFLGGSLKYEAPVRGPQEHGLYTPKSPDLVIDGIASNAAEDGTFSYDPMVTAVACYSASDEVQVENFGGPDEASLSFAPVDGQEVVWSLKDDELGDAQLSAFIHATIAKEYARQIDPAMPFLDKTLTLRVNQDEAAYACNAYWNGFTLNFFQEFQPCNNTARLADVVYHEFGHAFHTNSILPGVGSYDPGLGEGGADYYASIVTNDPYLAPGFFKNGNYLREFDSDKVWPQDIHWDPHETGLIFAGALWDLRTLLTEDLGPEEGLALTNQLYHAALRRAPNIPATFPEILAADDDDGDIGNGTPHVCQIVHAFATHGLTPYVSPSSLMMEHEPLRNLPVQAEPYPVSVKLSHAFPQCANGDDADSIELKWRTLVAGTTVQLTKNGDEWTGSIPSQPAGVQIRYQLISHAGKQSSSLPRNLADTEYKAFVGDVTPIYCTDFEADAGGFVFGEIDGKTTDFEWGAPYGKGGDPPVAFSGQSVLGTTLTELGLYRKNRTSFADSPPIDVGDKTRIRLQFMRWLTVEDGFFDEASVLVNGQRVWTNSANDEDSAVAHEDQEWRFEDFDIGNFTAGGNHTINVRFELAADDGVEYGGWNIDDFCIVAWEPPSTGEGGSGGGGGGGEGGAGGDDEQDAGCACSTSTPDSRLPGGAFFVMAASSFLLLRRRRGAKRS